MLTSTGVRRPAARKLALGTALAIALRATLAPAVAQGAPAVEACVRASDDGQMQRDGGRYSRAAADFARCSAADCPALVRRDCARWLEDLVALTPTIVPSARDASGNDLAAVRVLVDGTEVARQLDGRPIDLDPGRHVVSFEGPGGATAREQIVVRAGEKNRIVAVTLGAASPATSAKTPPRPPPRALGGPPVPVLPFVVGGAALVAFGLGLAFGLSSRSDLSTLEAEPCAATRTCNPSDVDAVRSKLVVSDVLIGAAAVGAVTSIALYFVMRPHDDRTVPASARIGVGPIPAGAQATFQASF
jgi:hypothetical protein